MARRSRSHSSPPAELDRISALLVFAIIFGSLALNLSIWWTISLITAGLTIVLFIHHWLRAERLRRLRRQQLLALSPSEFEQRVALLLEDLGWQRIMVRGGSGDRGVDITAERDGLRYIIQCKRYTKPVGPNYVRDLVGALQIQQADRAILVTTSNFTPQSRLEARGQALELWDDQVLLQRIEEADRLRAQQQPRRNGRTALLVVGAATVNLAVIGVAFLLSGMPVIASGVGQTGLPLLSGVAANTSTRRDQAAAPTATPSPTASPTATARPSPTPSPTPIPTATPVPLTASVFNGGNVRAAPNLNGTVLDQIHAYETVILLGRSSDGVWLRIINPRQQEGWVHRSLLTIDPAIEAALPVITP